MLYSKFKNPIEVSVPGNYQVNSIDMSNSGKVLIAGNSNEYGGESNSDFALYAYYANEGKLEETARVPINLPSYSGIYWNRISGDGKLVIAGGSYFSEDQSGYSNRKKDKSKQKKDNSGFVQFANLEDGSQNELYTYENCGRVNQVDISADGQYAIAVMGSFLKLYTYTNREGFEETYSFFLGKDGGSNALPYGYTCSLSADGRYIVVGLWLSDEKSCESEQKSKKTGAIWLLENHSGKIKEDTSYCIHLDTHVLRVAIDDVSQFFAATEKNGNVSFYSVDNTITSTSCPLWTVSPQQHGENAYALALGKNIL